MSPFGMDLAGRGGADRREDAGADDRADRQHDQVAGAEDAPEAVLAAASRSAIGLRVNSWLMGSVRQPIRASAWESSGSSPTLDCRDRRDVARDPLNARRGLTSGAQTQQAAQRHVEAVDGIGRRDDQSAARRERQPDQRAAGEQLLGLGWPGDVDPEQPGVASQRVDDIEPARRSRRQCPGAGRTARRNGSTSPAGEIR